MYLIIDKDLNVLRVENVKVSNTNGLIHNETFEELIYTLKCELEIKNTCPYCQENETDSVDSDILCKECSMTFGHTRFSEL